MAALGIVEPAFDLNLLRTEVAGIARVLLGRSKSMWMWSIKHNEGSRLILMYLGTSGYHRYLYGKDRIRIGRNRNQTLRIDSPLNQFWYAPIRISSLVIEVNRFKVR